MASIYLASSWRNRFQPVVVRRLRRDGHQVFDFRHPNGEEGFQWSTIDPNWRNWTNEEYLIALHHGQASRGYHIDFQALQEADTCVLLLPCGRSAHLEMGWAIGQGLRTYILLEEGRSAEPELMYKMVDGILLSLEELVKILT